MKKYSSRYTDRQITEAQYITERICENKSQLKNEELPQKFWNLPEWTVYFKRQHTLANRLLELYDGVVIIRVLKSPGAKRIYSLQAPSLDEMFKREQRLFDLEQEKIKSIVPKERHSTTEKPRERRPQNNILNRLGEIDGESEEGEDC